MYKKTNSFFNFSYPKDFFNDQIPVGIFGRKGNWKSIISTSLPHTF